MKFYVPSLRARHYKMHGMLKVVSQEEFDKWLVAREAEKQ